MTYWERNQILRKMGYGSYTAYLQSLLWHGIRTRVLLRQSQCEGCTAKASEVHHNYYSTDNLRGNTLDGLHSLCADCHDLIEMHDGHKILYPDEVQRRFLAVMEYGGYFAHTIITGRFPKPLPVTQRTAGETRYATDLLVTACQAVAPPKAYKSKWTSRR